MSAWTAAAVGWGIYQLVAVRRPGRPALGAGLAAALVVWSLPAAGLASGLVLLSAVRRRASRRRAREREAAEDLALLGELVLMGLTAGLPLRVALERARGELGPELGGEVEGLLREAGRVGLAAALARDGGRARRLYLRLARAHLTGAPLALTVASFVHEERDAERARHLEAARRLPVRLMVPLALLILPGFALLTVGPSLLAALERLAGPLWSALPPVVGRPPI